MADRLLESDTVVLAREDPQRPYHYAAVKTLKGDPGDHAIDLFMNTQVRRRLAGSTELAMVLAREAKSSKWRTLGLTQGDFESVVRRILGFGDQWVPRETGNVQRLRELAPLLGHEDMRLHELAYLEIGRAPYKLIKSIAGDVSLDRVRAILRDPRYLEWRGLDILLLGLSDADEDRSRIMREIGQRRSFARAANLDAWATAYVQVMGEAGIDQLTQWYFVEAGRTRDELKHVIRAMSVHATEDAALRPAVLAGYRELLNAYPRAAPDITRDLIAWQHWGFSPRMRELQPLLAEHDPLGSYAIKLYLQRAMANDHP